MRICLIGSGLTSLALAKALVNQNIHVDILRDKKKQIIKYQQRKLLYQIFLLIALK